MKNATFILLVFFISCQLFSQQFILNKIDSVQCDNHPEYWYSIFIPEIKPEKKYPVVFFFDPAARAKLPLLNYAELAKKYNVILACSYNSQNGPVNENKLAADYMIVDALSKFPIDRKLIFISGFSGGSRFSYYYASITVNIKAVIGCGAGPPFMKEESKMNNFFYTGIIGYEDFNFLEVYKLKFIHNQAGYPLQFITYNGGHQWPEAVYFERALLGCMYACNKENKTIRSCFIENESNAEKVYYKQKDFLASEWTVESLINLINEDSLKAEFMIRKEEITNLKEYKKEEKRFKKSLFIEDSSQIRWIRALQGIYQTTYNLETDHQPIKWWDYEIKEIKKLQKKKDVYKKRVGYRLLNYLKQIVNDSWRMYMEEHLYKQALELSQILLYTNKKSFNYYLMQTKAYIGLNNMSKAENAFTRAKAYGFNDITWAKSDPYLKKLFE